MRTRLFIAAACLFVAAGPAFAKEPSSKKPTAPTEIAGKKLDYWIKEAVDGSDPALRETAIRTLPYFGQPAADNPATVKALVAVLENDHDVACRVYACMTLSILGEHLPDDAAAAAVKKLIDKAAGDQGIVRLHAAFALASFGPRGTPAIPVLIKRAFDPLSWELRQAAIFALASVAADKKFGPDARAVAALAKLLNPPPGGDTEKSSRVRLAAVMALRVLGKCKEDKEAELAREAIRRAIRDPNKTVAIWAMAGEMVVDPQSDDAVVKQRFDKLLPFLTDKDVQLKVAVLSALGALGRDAERYVPDIAKRLDDPDPVVVATAIDVLAGFRKAAKDAVADLRRVMQKPDQREYFQRAAQHALKEITGVEEKLPEPGTTRAGSTSVKPPDPTEIEGKSLEKWMADIKDHDPSVQETAMQVVPYFGKRAARATKDLANKVKEPSADIACKAHAILALTAIADHLSNAEAAEAIQALIYTANKSDQTILRYHAVVGLGAFGSKATEAVPALINRIHDPNSWELRMAAVSALSGIGAGGDKTGPDLRALAAIADKLNSNAERSAQVRTMCVMGLGSMGRPANVTAFRQSVRALTAALEDRDKSVQIWAVVAVMAVDGVTDARLNKLGEYLKSKDVMTRCTAARALGAMGKDSKSKLPNLIDLLKDKDPAVVATAIDVLGGLGSNAHDAVGDLKKLMEKMDQNVALNKDQRDYLKDGAKYAIEKIDGKK